MIGIALMFALGWALTLRWSRRERERHRAQDAIQRLGGRAALELLLRYRLLRELDRRFDDAIMRGHLVLDDAWIHRPDVLEVRYSAWFAARVDPMTVTVHV